MGRLGLLIHSTAGFIDPGWDGHVMLEFSNVANLPITIYHGMKIGQISFMQLVQPTSTLYGSYRRSARSTRANAAPTLPLLAELPLVKILVTGANGFIGPKVVHARRAQLRDVRALVRRPGPRNTRLGLGVEVVAG